MEKETKAFHRKRFHSTRTEDLKYMLQLYYKLRDEYETKIKLIIDELKNRKEYP